ncbi:MAG: hypothetical protein ACFFD1_00815 [Candidatus Thorarchaeota archaeon]
MATIKKILAILWAILKSKNIRLAAKEFVDFIKKVSEKNKQINADGKRTKEEKKELRQLAWKKLKEVVDPIIDEI